jgi:hypothetical protein
MPKTENVNDLLDGNTPPLKVINCGSCVYLLDKAGIDDNCRRFPPNFQRRFPEVAKSDWGGEYKAGQPTVKR